jgi:endoglucanase
MMKPIAGRGGPLVLALLLGTLPSTPHMTHGAASKVAPPLPVFTDTPGAGWLDWSYGGVRRSFANAVPVHSGRYSVAVTYTGGWSGLKAARQEPINIAAYDTLRFWVDGGAVGKQRILVKVDGADGHEVDRAISPRAGAWTLVDVPLRSLLPAQVTAIEWFNDTAGAQPTYYLDDIAFINSGTSPAPPTTGPSATPTLPTVTLAPPIGHAPTIRVAGNHFVDGNGRTIRLLGVNFAGVEGACVDAGFQVGATDAHPGVVFDYQGPDPVVVRGQPAQPARAFLATLAAWHVNAVRFMVNEMCWLGRHPNSRNHPAVAPIPEAHYDSIKYRKAIIDFVASLHRYGMMAVAVLGDNPCPYHWPPDSATVYNPPGSEFSPCDDAQQVMPDAANAPAFWASFASTFKADHSIVFELYNEPHINSVRPTVDDWACWRNGCTVPGEGWPAAGMQQLIAAIRGAGATQPILVPGINYSAVIYRPTYGGGPAVGWIVDGTMPHDSLVPAQLAAANHIYNDTYDQTDIGCPRGSGPECWDNRLGIVAARVPLVTTELGEHDCDQSSRFMDRYMDWADSSPHSGRGRVSYLAWTFNADYNCNDANATLITDWAGTPNAAGLALQAHLAKNNGH